MADRSVTITLSADVSRLSGDFNKAATSVDRLATSSEKAGRSLDKASAGGKKLGDNLGQSSTKVSRFGDAMERVDAQSHNLNRISGTLLGIGAAATAGLAGAAKAAIDWETSWAGVAKTVDGSAAELAGLQDELREMARTLPASHEEIAAVAEAAGQLGVRTEDVAGFTKVMIDLGETTNLTADEAATSLAQFMNVMGTASEDVDRLGATIVDLGNNGASTEKQIVDMGQRIAGAGNQIGLSETEVLGYASALASVGINAEAGGTAISTSFLKIEQAVRAGGDQLEVLAETAGMTTEEFRIAFEENAAGAMQSFIEGLGRAQQSGQDTTAILRELGITGIRESDALRRLAGAGDLLSQSLDTSSAAWAENTALAEEAEKRYATTEAQIQIAWNNIKDAAIEAGAVLLPIIADVAGQIAELAGWFGELPEPVKNLAVAAVGFVAAAGLIAGGALRAATGAAELAVAFGNLRKTGGPAATAVSRVSRVAVVAGTALAALAIAQTVGQMFGEDFVPNVEEAARVLGQLSESAPQAATDLDAFFTTQSKGLGTINGLSDAFKIVNDAGFQFQDMLRGLIGQDSDIDVILQKFKAFDQILVEMPFEKSSAAFAQLRKEAENLGVPVEDLVNKYFPQYAERLRQVGTESGYTFTETGKLADAMGGELPPALDKANEGLDQHKIATLSAKEAQKELDTATGDLESAQENLRTETEKMVDELGSLRDIAISAERASVDFEAAIDDLAGATKEATEEGKKHAKSLDADTESGRKNRTAVLDAVEALNNKTVATFEDDVATQGLDIATRNASIALTQGKEDIREAGRAADLSEKEINRMIDEMVKTPEELKTDIKTPGMDAAQREIDDLKQRIKNLESHQVNITTDFRVTGTTMDFKTGKAIKLGNKVITQFQHEGGPVQNLSGMAQKGVDTEVIVAGLGEHMWTDREVDAVGGHDAMYQMRAAALRGELRGYRTGGEIRRRNLLGRPISLSGRPSGLHGRPTEEEEITVHGRLAGYKINPKPLMDAYAVSMSDWGEDLADKMASKYTAAAEEALQGNAGVHGNFSKIDISNPGGRAVFRGGAFTNLFAANLQRAEKIAGQTIRVFQGGFRPTTSYSGTSHAGDAVDLQVSGALISALRSVGIAAWDRTGRGPWVPHVHGVPLPGAGYAGGSAVWQAQDYMRGGDGLADGGPITGPGGPKDDLIWVRASNGEYMLSADGYSKNKDLVHAINDGRIRSDRTYSRDTAPAGTGGIGTTALQQALSGMRIEGTLTLRDGEAYVRGIAVPVAQDAVRTFAGSLGSGH